MIFRNGCLNHDKNIEHYDFGQSRTLCLSGISGEPRSIGSENPGKHFRLVNLFFGWL